MKERPVIPNSTYPSKKHELFLFTKNECHDWGLKKLTTAKTKTGCLRARDRRRWRRWWSSATTTCSRWIASSSRAASVTTTSSSPRRASVAPPSSPTAASSAPSARSAHRPTCCWTSWPTFFACQMVFPCRVRRLHSNERRDVDWFLVGLLFFFQVGVAETLPEGTLFYGLGSDVKRRLQSDKPTVRPLMTSYIQ